VEDTKKAYFSTPKKINENFEIIVDESITDKFRFSKVNVNGKYEHIIDSYGILIVTDGEIILNGISLKAGDRVFISERERNLIFQGSGEAFICQP